MKLHHIGIAVESLDKTLPTYGRLLGAQASATVTVPEQKVRVVVFQVGESRIELLEPTSPESPVARFLSQRGQGIHHLAFTVAKLDETLAELEQQGVRLVDRQSRQGAEGRRIAFVHPASTAGVLIELIEEQ